MWLLTARKSCIFSAFFGKKFAPFSLIFRPLLCILESRRQTHFPSGSSRGGSLGHSHFCTKTLLMSCVASQQNYSYLCSLRILSLQGRIPLYSWPHLLKKTDCFAKKPRKSQRKKDLSSSPQLLNIILSAKAETNLSSGWRTKATVTSLAAAILRFFYCKYFYGGKQLCFTSRVQFDGCANSLRFASFLGPTPAAVASSSPNRLRLYQFFRLKKRFPSSFIGFFINL